MATPMGGTEVICTLEGYLRTFVLEFPGSQLASEEHVAPQLIADGESLRAASRVELPAYFQEGHSKFQHHVIDISLRVGVDRVFREDTERKVPPQRPMFIVIEQYEHIPPTKLDNGECFRIDEWRDGKELVEGGREGKKALLAIRTSNSVWPDFSPDMQGVNTVLAALKVEQDVTQHIEERYSCSCFVSDDGAAVYSFSPTMSVGYGGLRVLAPIDATKLEAKVASIRSIHDGIRRDSETIPQVAELAESLLVDKTQDDRYFRLWYLRLWQATVDCKRHLGEPALEQGQEVLAGKLTPKQLKEYRNNIAHWWTGKVDFSFVTSIQQTVVELLRRKYRVEE